MVYGTSNSERIIVIPKNKKILATGANGFLLSHLLPHLEKNNTIIKCNKKIHDINENDLHGVDILLHFGSPSEKDEFKNIKQTARIVGLDSIELFRNFKYSNFLEKGNPKIIFASTMGIYDCSNVYEVSKKFAEMFLEEEDLILRIPRVYGKNKNKGLIKKLKN